MEMITLISGLKDRHLVLLNDSGLKLMEPVCCFGDKVKDVQPEVSLF